MISIKFWAYDMQILLNELSLTGQFSDHNAFLKNGLLPLLAVFKEMQALSSLLLLKKSDVWNRMVTSDCTLHAMLVSSEFRKSDEFRRLKTAIDWLTHEPFWDVDAKHDKLCVYLLDGINVADSSIAEACERDKLLASFMDCAMSTATLTVTRNAVPIQLLNVTKAGELTEFFWNEKLISFETYVKSQFSSGKLDFMRVDNAMGFNTVQPDEQALFIDSFRKFNAMPWELIYKDKGFDYKQYHASLSAAQGRTSYKFRVSRKMRCHGYREDERFVVIGFETDHALSDGG